MSKTTHTPSNSFYDFPLGASTLVELLRRRARQQPEQRAYTFLIDGEIEGACLTYKELDEKARAIGGLLESLGATGQRVLLLYPPSLDYVAAFFGCLYAGAVAVPAYPPRQNRNMLRIQTIVADAQATVTLTTSSILSNIERYFEHAPDLKTLRWIDTENVSSELARQWKEPEIDSNSLAFLQYTSGSTAAPKGVMVSHGNLLHNGGMIQQVYGLSERTVTVSWLPLYHDMGLIGKILQSLYIGAPCILMPSVAFLQRPLRWLQAITRYRGTFSGAPNFAYDLCARKITPEERASLDLSSWSAAFNGSEPVRYETQKRFAETFKECGLRWESLFPSYGLAEATLFVSSDLKAGGTVTCTVDKAALENNRVVPLSAESDASQTLVSCGQVLGGQEVAIVDPQTLVECQQDGVGEIWLSGPSVAHGYWNRREATEQTFEARLAHKGDKTFLRTGDLGFLHRGDLYIAGRLKDLIIIRGRNHYPQDIELTVERSHPALRPSCSAAFTVEADGEERLVVVQEVERTAMRNLDYDEVLSSIREAVAEQHELEIHQVALIRTGTITKTSSGKIQRAAAREKFLGGGLDLITKERAPRTEPGGVEVERAERPLPVHSESVSARKGMEFSLFYFSSNDAEFSKDKYQLFLEGAKFADRNGFTAVWTPERHFHAFGGLYPNPSVLSAALATTTERVRLRAGSVVLPLHNSIRVAEEWAVVDNLSRGRVDIAFARGWNPNDFVLSPQNFANNKEVLFEEIQTVRRLWRGETVTVPNGLGKDTEIKIYPLPQQRELSVWITCSGGEERFIEAGASGHHVLTALLFQPIEELAQKIAAYREARSQHGYDPQTGHVTLMLHTFVGEDLSAVRETVRQPFIEYLKTSVNLWRQGLKSLDDLKEHEREELLAYAFERYFQTSALFGTPESCLERVEQLKEIGVNEIACLIDFGVDVASVLHSLKTLNALRKLSNGESESVEERHEPEALHLPREVAGATEAFPRAVVSEIKQQQVFASQTSSIVHGHQSATATEGSAMRALPSGANVDTRSLLRSVREIIIRQVAHSLKIEPQRVPLDKNFHSLGVDSLKAVEIMDGLARGFDITLSSTLLFASPTINDLVEHLVEEHTEKLRAYMERGAADSSGAAAPTANEQTPGQGATATDACSRSAKPETMPAHVATAQENIRVEDIAVVGMACRFPQVPNLASFWKLLREGKSAIREVPADHWDWREYYDADPNAEHKTYSRWGGFLDDIDQFDPAFFNISPREARLMDPQQRLFLEVAWETLEQAGHSAESLAENDIGVFVGCSNNSYFPRMSSSLTSLDHSAGIGNQNAIIANRVSFFLNLRGPSVLIDTMCSSSLVALHMACQSLRQGECSAALVGGVNALLSPDYFVNMSLLKALSPDGHCKTFDHRADGIAFGEGAGAVLLKPLGRAIEDGDTIYAVIKGTAINHGGQTNGLTAPNPRAQAQVIRRALDAAGVSADTISYVEAHGTGTSLGDPIEIEGLTAAFRHDTDRKQFCAIGSVKTNIGHLEPAAGISGLIKIVLSMQHRLLPPSLNFERPNPKIAFEESPFRVNTELSPWTAQGPLRAGISSFGMGGTNAHVVLEEPPALNPVTEQTGRPLHLLTLSAKSETALRTLAGLYAAALAESSLPAPGDVCYTANAGRSHFTHRLAVVADSAARLSEQLNAFNNGDEARDVYRKSLVGDQQTEVEVVFLFTGQGSQYSQMGRELFETQPTFRRVLKQCDEILRPHLEQPLLSVLFQKSDGSLLIDETAYTQPALFALEYALAQLWMSWGIKPSAVMGHSVGEYVAACVAGVFTLEDGLRLIAERGRLMQSLPRAGEMAAVFAGEEEVRAALSSVKEQVSIAAVNGQRNVVISGAREAVRAVVRSLEAEGIKSQTLNVSHAFHSPLMDLILDRFGEAARSVDFSTPRLPLVSNLDGRVMGNGFVPGADYWRRHLREPVRFAEGINTLGRLGHRVFLELGPNPSLNNMGRRCLTEATATWLPSLKQGAGEWRTLLGSLCKLYVEGVKADWAGFDRDYARRRVALPTYPFERKRYWVELDAGAPRQTESLMQAVAQTPSGSGHSQIQNGNGNGNGMKHAATLHRDELEVSMTIDATRKEQALKILRAFLSRFLEVDAVQVDVHQPFLEMGTDSLVLIEAIQTIQNTFGVKLAIRQLFEELNTLDRLAAYVDQQASPELSFASPAPPPAPVAALPAPPAPEMPVAPVQINEEAESRTTLERIMSQQLTTLSQLMSQQLEVLKVAPAAASITSQPAASVTSQHSSLPTSDSIQRQTPHAAATAFEQASREVVASVSNAGAPAEEHGDGPKPWLPYQPLNPGRLEDLNPRQQKYLTAFIERYAERTRESKRRTQAHRFAHADLRAAMSFRLCTKEIRYPIIGAHSDGSKLWDVDGNEYVDFTMGYGVNLFGHAAPFITEALEEQLRRGIQLGPQSELAGEVAELICELTGMERVTFCNSGTEAVMGALRLARVATGRKKIAVFAGSYHGTSDGVLVAGQVVNGKPSSSPMVPGIMPGMVEDMLVLNYGSARSLEIIKAHLDELAAVLVEPVQSRRPDLQPKEFLQQLRRLTEEAGVALIFDEVITGFRIHQGGAQAWFGVEADIATYGKVIGGGMPIGAIAGRAAFMNGIDGGAWRYGDTSLPDARTTLYTGTFCKHPLAMAAARAVLKRIQTDGPEMFTELNRRTTRLAEDLNAYFAQDSVPIQVAQFGSLFRFGGPFQLHSPDGMDLLFYHLIDKGIYVWEGRNWFLSTAHTDEDIETVVRVVKESVADMREGNFLPEAPAAPPHDEAQGTTRSNGDKARAGSVRSAASSVIEGRNREWLALPMTETQKQLWYLSQTDGDNEGAYHQSIILRMIGAFDMQAMQAAFQKLVNRHEALRTTFNRRGEMQRIHQRIEIELPLVDYTGQESSEREALVNQWLETEGRRPFKLAGEESLLRASVLKLEPQHYLLVITAHHIVTDGWSLGVVVKEVGEFYSAEREGKECALPEPMQFREYVERRAAELHQPETQRAEAFWLRQLDGSASFSPLPTDYPRRLLQTSGGARQYKTLDAALCARLSETSAQQGCTLFMTLLAAYSVLIHQLTAQEESVIVMPAAGQSDVGAAHLIGDCSNLLPLRSRIEREIAFTQHLASIKRTLLGSYEVLNFPFSSLITKLNPPQDPSRWPFFNIDKPLAAPKFTDLRVEFVQFPIGHTNFDLSLNITQFANELQLAFDYKTELFDAETIQGWMNHFEKLLEALVSSPSTRISDLPQPLVRDTARREAQVSSVPQAHGELTEKYVAPRNATERMLAQLWAELLGVKQIGVEDNFFLLGGHSLLATRLISRVRSATGVELMLRPLFENPTVAGLAECVERAQREGQRSQAPPVRRTPRDEVLPLSFNQQRLWFIEQLEPGNAAYNMPGAMLMKGRLDSEALQMALCEIVRRHESLRTTFSEVAGHPVQVVGEATPLGLPVIDVSDVPEAERRAEALRRANEEVRLPFDLSKGPLMRASLLRLREEEHVLVVAVHHIAGDGWSMGLLVGELEALYEAFSTGQPSPLPELEIQYADYAVWQREWLQGEMLESQLAYWHKQLAGAPSLTELPTDRSRKNRPSFRGASESFVFPVALTEALKELGQREGATLFMTLLAALQTLLYRYSGQEDLIVGTDIANRNSAETEGLIGFFVNLLALRTDMSGDPKFRELLGRVREVTLGAYAHQDVPFGKLVEVLRPERGLSKTPLVQVLCVLQNAPMPPLKLAGLEVSLLPVESGTAEFELILTMEETSEGLGGSLIYSTDLFEQATIAKMLRQYQTLLESIVVNPDEHLSGIRLLTETESGGLAASDFPDAELSQRDFENLFLNINKFSDLEGH
jgi:natural product biosynthesis luciferase-like monooxygenase protein